MPHNAPVSTRGTHREGKGRPGPGEEWSVGRSLVVKREPQKVLNGDLPPVISKECQSMQTEICFNASRPHFRMSNKSYFSFRVQADGQICSTVLALELSGITVSVKRQAIKL